MSLGEGCHRKGVVIHELLHALGMTHEHCRADRNEFIRINMENIKKGKYLWSNEAIVFSTWKTESEYWDCSRRGAFVPFIYVVYQRSVKPFYGEFLKFFSVKPVSVESISGFNWILTGCGFSYFDVTSPFACTRQYLFRERLMLPQ